MNRLPIIVIIGACESVVKETVIALKRDSKNMNFRIKAGVKDVDDSLSILDSFGVEAIYCDINIPESVEEALKDASRVFLIPANDDNKVIECSTIVDVAKKCEIEHFVFMSLIGTEEKDSEFHNQFKECEQIIQNSGLNFTILRTSFIQEMLFSLSNEISNGKLRLPIGSAKFAPVSIRDVGEVASNILLKNGNKYHNKVITLTGDQLVTGEDVAQILTRVTGSKVTFEHCTEEETKRKLMKDLGFEEWRASAVINTYKTLSKGGFNSVSEDNKRVLCRNPYSLERTLNGHKYHFMIRRAVPSGVSAK